MSDEEKLTDRQLSVLTSLRTAVKGPPTPVRACGDCSRCCEGWLTASVFGHSLEPGRPCFFLEKNCSIYAQRPIEPCKNYRCAWLGEDVFPMWMRPNLSNLIISQKLDGPTQLCYYVVDPAGDHDPRALAWIKRWATETEANVEYRVEGEIRRQGAPAFVAAKPR